MADDIGPLTVGTVQELENHDATRSRWECLTSETLIEASTSTLLRHLHNVLRIVEGAGEPLAQRDIARRLLVSRANVTGLVDKLEAVGYVERCAVVDRRVNVVRLTPQGRAFLHTTFAEQVAMCQAALAALSPADLQALLHLTTKLLQERQ